MYTKSIVVAAALGFVRVNADVEIITGRPAFPAAPSGVDGVSWSKSVANDISIGLGDLNNSLANKTSFVSEVEVAASKFDEFAKTATTIGIPAEATDTAKDLTFTTVPSWYSAAPTEYKSVNDKYNSMVSDVYASAFAKATGGSVPSGTGISLHAPPSTTSSAPPAPLKPNATGPPTTTPPSGAGSELMVGAGALLAGAGAAIMFAL